MADEEKMLLDHIKYTGVLKDGTSVEGQDVYFYDAAAHNSINELNNKTEDQKTKQESIILSADGWKGDDAPYTYDLGDTYKDKCIVIGFDRTNGNDGQLVIAQAAGLVGGDGTIIYATQEKPLSDIPVIIQYS